MSRKYRHHKNIGILFIKAAAALVAAAVLLLLLCKIYYMNYNNAQLVETTLKLQGENQRLQAENQELQDQVIRLSSRPQFSPLIVKGTRLYNEEGEPVVLQGVSSHGLAWYPEYTNYHALKTLKDFGANLFRISMYVEQNDGYMEEPEWNIKLLYSAIENSLAAGLYTIVDWHVLRDEDPNRHVEEALQVFEELSSRYADEPGIIYEICNEPNGDTTWEDVCRYAEQVIPVIRKNAPNALILVGTPNYCTDFSGPMEKPLAFDNIMYSMHRYIDVSYEESCDIYLIQKVVERGIPVFVSEWGMGKDWEQEEQKEKDSDSDRIYVENADPFIEYMAEHKISWAAWALTNGDSAHGIIKKECERLGSWSSEDLTPYGQFLLARFQETLTGS